MKLLDEQEAPAKSERREEAEEWKFVSPKNLAAERSRRLAHRMARIRARLRTQTHAHPARKTEPHHA